MGGFVQHRGCGILSNTMRAPPLSPSLAPPPFYGFTLEVSECAEPLPKVGTQRNLKIIELLNAAT